MQRTTQRLIVILVAVVIIAGAGVWTMRPPGAHPNAGRTSSAGGVPDHVRSLLGDL